MPFVDGGYTGGGGDASVGAEPTGAGAGSDEALGGGDDAATGSGAGATTTATSGGGAGGAAAGVQEESNTEKRSQVARFMGARKHRASRRRKANVGDVYLLYRDIVKDNPTAATDKPHLRHCGFIAYVPERPGEAWITADGGQNPGGGGAYLNRRPWELRLPSQTNTGAKQSTWNNTLKAHPFAQPIQDTPYPYLGGGAESQGNLTDANRLIGWIDMDHPSIIFNRSEELDMSLNQALQMRQPNRYTESDYQFLGAWIDALRGARPNALAGWLAHLKDPVNNPLLWQPSAFL